MIARRPMQLQFSIIAVPMLLLAMLAAGCASDPIETSVTFDPLTSFPAQATIAWDQARNKLPEDERLRALDLGPAIESAAEAEFARRGYTRTTGDSADYLVSYQASVNSWIGADNSRAVGTVSILLIEARSGRHVWLGFGRSEIQVGRDPVEREKYLREAMAKMLKNFPPNQAR